MSQVGESLISSGGLFEILGEKQLKDHLPLQWKSVVAQGVVGQLNVEHVMECSYEVTSSVYVDKEST